MAPEPVQRVLVAGAGVAALEAMLALGDLAGDRLRIDLVAATADFVYRPLAVVEPFGRPASEHRLRLGRIVRDRGAGHVYDDLAAVDPERRRIRGTSGADYDYDALVVAIGARALEAVPGAVTFHGRDGVAGYRKVLAQLGRGSAGSVALAVPSGTAWSLPAYELAMLTAAWLRDRGADRRVAVVTPEERPLAPFGQAASDAVAELLERHGIDLHTGAGPVSAADGELLLDDGRTLTADRVAALPRLTGPAVPGLPAGDDGFVPVDEHGRVAGLDRVYAAGDAASWPVKQGGLAAQQADAVAESLAAWAGAPVRPTPFRPVLRGVLMAGEEPLFVRADSRAGRQRSMARIKPLWWPPAKVAGRWLSPYLAARGIQLPAEPLSA